MAGGGERDVQHGGHIFASDGPKLAVLCLFEKKSLIFNSSERANCRFFD